MSLAQPPLASSLQVPPSVPTEAIWPLSVRHYHEMIRSGILTEDDPVELLEGLLVVKMPKYPRHTTSTKRTEEAIRRLLPVGWYVRAQEPVALADSEPEPDLAVVLGDPDRYVTRHPGPRDVGLVVEVADATLERDRRTKVRVYGAARLPVYWIINLVDNQVEVYSLPSGPGSAPAYRRRRDYGPNDEVPVVIRRREIGSVRVSDLIPGISRRRGRGNGSKP